MVTVERGNVILTIEEQDIDFYVNKGYNLVENGKVVRAAVPNDLGELQQYYITAQARIRALENTVAELTAENRRLQKRAQKTANN